MAEDESGTPVIVFLKPGTAAEKAVKFRLPEDSLDRSVKEVLEYGLGLTEEDGVKREGLRVQEKIKLEMHDQYGVSVNGNAVKGTELDESVTKYLVEETSPQTGRAYKKLEIVVAGRQSGASWANEYVADLNGVAGEYGIEFKLSRE